MKDSMEGIKKSSLLKYDSEKDFILAHYKSDLGDLPVLTKEEEIELVKKIKNGNQKAKEELILRNTRLVFSIAKRYSSSQMSLQDLIGEGNIGLIRAVDAFEPSMGNKFSTCATTYIKNSILDALSD